MVYKHGNFSQRVAYKVGKTYSIKTETHKNVAYKRGSIIEKAAY